MPSDDDNGDETGARKLTEGQKKVLRRVRRILISIDGIAPSRVRREDTVTIVGEDLYGVKDVRVGGVRAPIVKRGQDDDGKLETLDIFIPESARDGVVKVLDLELIEDDHREAS